MYVDNRRHNKGSLGKEVNDEKSFVFDASDMKALNRFLGTGRRLPTTRAEYLRSLGIVDNPGEVSKELGKEVETLVGTYSSVSISLPPCASSVSHFAETHPPRSRRIV